MNNNIVNQIREELFRLQDRDYGVFQQKLIPTAPPESFIGVRTPELRKLAKELVKSGEAEAFLKDLPHKYFDEDQLHAFIVSEIKDYCRCLEELERFLPYVDNWATCDQMSPKVFKKHRKELLAPIKSWMESGETYTVRFGMGMLMEHYLDEDFDPSYLEAVASVVSEEYYVRMMQAWYFATALAKQYEAAVPFIEEKRLEPWTHNKAIQKSLESFRIPPERKEYLKSLRIKSR